MRALLVALLIVALAPTTRPGKNFAFAIDVSGSMRKEDRLGRAVRGYLDIAQQGSDDYAMRLRVFDNHARAWRAGWVNLPDKLAVDAAHEWLLKQAARGGTRVGPVLAESIREPRRELTVILISDGQFYQETGTRILNTVAKAQAWRVEQGLGKAVVAVVFVGNHEPSALMLQLAKEGGGGCFRVE